MGDITYEALREESVVEYQATPGFPLSAAAGWEFLRALSLCPCRTYYRVEFPGSCLPCRLPPLLTQPFLPQFHVAKPFKIYSSITAFSFAFLTLATLCKMFPLSKSFPFSFISCCSVTSLPRYPFPILACIAAESRPDVVHISLARKAAYAFKTARVEFGARLGNNLDIMTAERYLSPEYLHGALKGQMSLGEERNQSKPSIRQDLAGLDRGDCRTKGLNPLNGGNCPLSLRASRHMCLI